MDAELPKAQAARPATGWDDTVALTGFILVAVGQASNQVLARGLAGSVPPFSLAFFRWSIIAIGLAPFAIAAVTLATGSFPDIASDEGKAAIGADAFIFINFARLIVPARIAFALGLAPWVDENIVKKFGGDEKEE